VADERPIREGEFERHGLLDGLEADEREARVDLLGQLMQSGAGIEELKRAIEQDRLALLPIERLFRDEARYTFREYAQMAGLREEFLRRDFLALGLPVPDPDEPQFSDRHIAAGQMLKQVIDAGLGEEGVLEMARTVGRASAVTAEAILQTFAEAFLSAGTSERDLGLQFAQLAKGLMPMADPLLGNIVALHMREIVRSAVIGRAERVSGRLPGTTEITVAFADMVGFTQLGQATSAEGVGSVARQFEVMAAGVAKRPVRLIKLIGDAAMLVSDETDQLLETTSRLVAAASATAGFPHLRAGVARGPAFRHAGDWYGYPVNLASRSTGVAPAETVLASTEVVEAAGSTFAAAAFGEFALKGIDAPVALYQVDRTPGPH
jgi:adenylate cyclase